MTDFSSRKASQQGTNPVQTGFNHSQLFELLIDISSEWKEEFRLDVKLLQAICHLSLANPERAETGFTSIDIVEKVGELRSSPWSTPNDGSQMATDVRKQWKNLLKTWESKKEGIEQELADEDISLFPDLDRVQGGGAGNASRYRILWRQLDDQDKEALKARARPDHPVAPDSVVYICEDIENPNALVRLFAKGYGLYGWRKYLYVTAIGVPLLFGYLVFVIILINLTYLGNFEAKLLFNSFASLAIYSFLIWKFIGPLIRLPDDQIVLAPWGLQSSDKDRLLERRSPPQYSDKSIKAVRYTAKCPVCGGKVHAKSGGLEFWGRIVGMCAHSPKEHLFSFDHVTRRGKNLR
ncbi:hypothetical protein [Sedimenticola hydrogenitrophicus]|uniref:hypothetical protein n=1 Tax=Sedimenticola hydrogenitrophicus TaxID=2967975 RepID=UPI0023B040E8|nr:hypothetical protein [Sedimenticola hydrogenitrophicus]